jgi:hypothetical protein
MKSILRFLRELIFDLAVKEPLKNLLFIAILGGMAWLFGINYGVIRTSVSRFFDRIAAYFEPVPVQRADTTISVREESPSETIVRKGCAVVNSAGVVKCDTLYLRADHSSAAGTVGSVMIGDSVDALSEWNPDFPNSVKALYPLYLQMDDSIPVPIDQQQELLIEGEHEGYLAVRTLDGRYSGKVSKDSVEVLGPWLWIRTATCDSGWVPSDSVEVLGPPGSADEAPP